MTQAQDIAKEALQKLTDQLTCSVCLDQYTGPKVLPCLHVFCKRCLERLVVKDAATMSVCCPNCRQSTRLPQGGVSGLQTAFYINYLFEVYHTLQKMQGPDKARCDKCGENEAKGYCRTCGQFVCQLCITTHAKWVELSSHELATMSDVEKELSHLIPPKKVPLYCPIHPTTIRNFYCETCRELICKVCTECTHHFHQYNSVDDAFPRHWDAIVSSLKPMKQRLEAVSKAIKEANMTAASLTEQGSAINDTVNKAVYKLHEILESRRHQVTTQVDELVQRSIEKLRAQQEQCELSKAQIDTCITFVEDSLRTGTPEEIVSMKESVVERSEQIIREFDPTQFNPQNGVALSCENDSTKPIEDAIQSFCKVSVCSLPQEGSHRHWLRPPSTEPNTKAIEEGFFATGVESLGASTFNLQTSTTKGDQVGQDGEYSTGNTEKRVEGKAVSMPGDTTEAILAKEQAKEDVDKQRQAQQSNSPSVHEQQLENVVKTDRPTSNDNQPQTETRTRAIQAVHIKTVGSVKSPRQLAVHESGLIVVAEQDANSVAVLDSDGQKLYSFGKLCSREDGKLKSPLGVKVVSDNTVLVTAKHCIKRYTLEGRFIASAGSRGSGELQFETPFAVATSPTNDRIYVCDTYNNRIQVLNHDFTFLSSFGSEGKKPGQFRWPEGIACDSRGNIFVCDYRNNRVQKFSPEGHVLLELKHSGSGLGYLQCPSGVCLDSFDFLYVLEWVACRVSVYDPKGNLVKSFGKSGRKAGEFGGSYGIAVDECGCIYVSDTAFNQIHVFK